MFDNSSTLAMTSPMTSTMGSTSPTTMPPMCLNKPKHKQTFLDMILNGVIMPVMCLLGVMINYKVAVSWLAKIAISCCYCPVLTLSLILSAGLH